MFEFLQAHQLNIMLGMSSICFAVGFFALITKSLPRKRKLAITDLEFSACILLYSDRMAYIYHGDPSNTGYWLVRIANFLVFFMTISVVHAFNLYVSDLCRNEIGLAKVPFRLRIVEIITGVGWFLVILSQFIGLYYYFDETNAYHRGPGFIICYLIPFLALFIQLSVVFQYAGKLSLFISIPMLLFTILPIIASICQAFFYGVSLTNMSIVATGVVLYIFAIMEMNEKYESAQKRKLDEANEANRSVMKSFEQTAVAVARAVDSREGRKGGHSQRVADYSREIARNLGMSEKECYKVYLSAVLHDIGKIVTPDTILENKGRLTEKEKEILHEHVITGGEILSTVDDYPFLKTAAKYHHERYDSKGYPEGLRGEDIPLTARIVAVANAYDEMTSYKDDREPMAQGRVRKNLASEAGKKFDPHIVDVMIGMIDRDTEYMMKEADEEYVEEADKSDITVVNRMHFDNYKEQVSDGIRVTGEYLKLRFESRPDVGYERKNALPTVILFDSFDRCVHRNERTIKNLRYLEFGEIWMDGHVICTAARTSKSEVTTISDPLRTDENEWMAYELEAVLLKDHVKIRINSKYSERSVIMALPDSTRYVFLALAGEHCTIRNITVTKTHDEVKEGDIERIAPEVDFFTRKDGDIPNIQIDGYRESTSEARPVEDGMRIFFRTESLPIADLVHHCPYLLLYSSDDGEVTGRNYQEFACIRLDGDDATYEGKAQNKLTVHKRSDFGGWDAWKEINKKGLDYEIRLSRRKNRIRMETENAGISIDCLTVVPEGTDCVYIALTGNLCALMDIRFR